MPAGSGGTQHPASDGSRVYVTGESFAANHDSYATVAYDAATGATLWHKRYTIASNTCAISIAVSPDGTTVYVTGYTLGGANGRDYVTIAYGAAAGAQQWAKRHNVPATAPTSPLPWR